MFVMTKPFIDDDIKYGKFIIFIMVRIRLGDHFCFNRVAKYKDPDNKITISLNGQHFSLNKLQAFFISHKIESEINKNSRKTHFEFTCDVQAEKTQEIIKDIFKGTMKTQDFDVEEQVVIDLFNIGKLIGNDYLIDPYYLMMFSNISIENLIEKSKLAVQLNRTDKVIEYIVNNRQQISANILLDICQNSGFDFTEKIIMRIDKDKLAIKIVFNLIMNDLQFAILLKYFDNKNIDPLDYEKFIAFTRDFASKYPNNLEEGILILDFVSKLLNNSQFGNQAINILAVHPRTTGPKQPLYGSFLYFLYVLNKKNSSYKINITDFNENMFREMHDDEFLDTFDVITVGGGRYAHLNSNYLVTEDFVKQIMSYHDRGGSVLIFHDVRGTDEYSATWDPIYKGIFQAKEYYNERYSNQRNKLPKFEVANVRDKNHPVVLEPFPIPKSFNIEETYDHPFIPAQYNVIGDGDVNIYYSEVGRYGYCQAFSQSPNETEEKVIYNIICHLFTLSNEYRKKSNL